MPEKKARKPPQREAGNIDLTFEDLKDFSRVKWVVSQNLLVFLLLGGSFLSLLIFIAGLALYGFTQEFFTVLLLGVAVSFSPSMYYLYYQYRKVQEMEDYFPSFLRDIADAQRAGTTLPKAIYGASNIHYGALSAEVKKMADQISWGVPFEEAMVRFKNRVNSGLIRRSIDIILEANRAGGQISSIFDTLTADTQKIKDVENERKSTLQVQVYSVYFIYIVFLFIIVVLQNLLLPSMPAVGNIAKILGGSGQTLSEQQFYVYLLHLTLIQGFFIGLLAGEMSSGSVVAGLRHSMILMVIGFLVINFFASPPNLGDRITRLISIIPGAVDLEVSVGEFVVQNNVTTAAIHSGLQKTAESDQSKAFLKEIKLEDISIVDAGCRECNSETAYVTEDGTQFIVRKPIRVDVEMLIKDRAYIIQIR